MDTGEMEDETEKAVEGAAQCIKEDKILVGEIHGPSHSSRVSDVICAIALGIILLSYLKKQCSVEDDWTKPT